ncbi:glycosyltransferase [Streptacidiphilus sp. P02-A3a]|uniref:glycosyltransferase n=1 Tax=Streptacidiphilus sp. P02-A3a TaxID=2704468 RepID=UPI0015FDBB7E|nr:glycosyltransferase family 2 protein [Streptacidiphilus sp. P02-A3a]
MTAVEEHGAGPEAAPVYHAEVTDRVNLLVVDNHPTGPHAWALKRLEQDFPQLRYVPYDRRVGTAARDRIFREAASDWVMCVDSHVQLAPGALAALLDHIDRHPDSGDPAFARHGGEEGHLHDKFRRAGGVTRCLPALRWTHRFDTPRVGRTGSTWYQRLFNYLIGFDELGQSPRPGHRPLHRGTGRQGRPPGRGRLPGGAAEPVRHLRRHHLRQPGRAPRPLAGGAGAAGRPGPAARTPAPAVGRRHPGRPPGRPRALPSPGRPAGAHRRAGVPARGGGRHPLPPRRRRGAARRPGRTRRPALVAAPPGRRGRRAATSRTAPPGPGR